MNERREYSFQRTYRLKAQSPLVHFQGYQLYATLRASEVKPRLDAFLRARAGERIDPSWEIRHNAHHAPLRYQMSIMRDSATLYVDFAKTPDFPAYYGRGFGRRLLVGDVQVNIVCLIPALRELIDEYIDEFFLTHNFGALQSRGFGSFTVEGREHTPDEIAAALKRKFGVEHCYAIDAEKPFCTISILHSAIKSGCNRTRDEGEGAYQRSLLFTYLHDVCGLGNEKAWIKREKLALVPPTRHAADEPTHPPRYVRGLLGLTTNFNFLDTQSERGNMHVRARSLDRHLQRHRSPLFFKVVGNTVYFLITPIDPSLYGAEFEFSSPRGSGILAIPTEAEVGEQFHERFMTYCIDRFNDDVLDKFAFTRGARIREVGV